MLISLFETSPVRRLLDLELAALAPELAGLYGAQGLFLRPAASAPQLISTPLLDRLSTLHVVAPDRLHGDMHCDPAALPFDDDSFRLVLVQHVTEVIADSDALLLETARVLAPEGTALVLGFHPVSLWRPWLHLRAREGLTAVLRSPRALQHHLARAGVDVYASKRIGPLWPREAAAGPVGALDPLRAAYLLIARKRRASLTPLRSEPARGNFALRPTLVSGAHRACV